MIQLHTMASPTDDEEDEDEPQSRAEALAEEEDARMQLLLDRVTARIEPDSSGSSRR